ncbi:Aste57867_12977 [Aphanomyces stellatus]|uniref:Aste57867_12977 protein n=1 Tax=Aphanomyces stellatus TaxID=120398 RepID=A0A485KYL4_9STRA|nr:hypothetical protein As57867_012929 [Aphanomyces stellatus]VFT89823.1 Aste57867_12977 [Aphanomyces stellatus]
MPSKKRTKIAPASAFVCQYTSKRCDRARSAKKNGELHRLCEYHRSKANRFQKEYKQRATYHKALISTLDAAADGHLDPIPFLADDYSFARWNDEDYQMLCDAIIRA